MVRYVLVIGSDGCVLDIEAKSHVLKRYPSEFELVINELQGLLVLHPLID